MIEAFPPIILWSVDGRVTSRLLKPEPGYLMRGGSLWFVLPFFSTRKHVEHQKVLYKCIVTWCTHNLDIKKRGVQGSCCLLIQHRSGGTPPASSPEQRENGNGMVQSVQSLGNHTRIDWISRQFYCRRVCQFHQWLFAHLCAAHLALPCHNFVLCSFSLRVTKAERITSSFFTIEMNEPFWFSASRFKFLLAFRTSLSTLPTFQLLSISLPPMKL